MLLGLLHSYCIVRHFFLLRSIFCVYYWIIVYLFPEIQVYRVKLSLILELEFVITCLGFSTHSLFSSTSAWLPPQPVACLEWLLPLLGQLQDHKLPAWAQISRSLFKRYGAVQNPHAHRRPFSRGSCIFLFLWSQFWLSTIHYHRVNNTWLLQGQHNAQPNPKTFILGQHHLNQTRFPGGCSNKIVHVIQYLPRGKWKTKYFAPD